MQNITAYLSVVGNVHESIIGTLDTTYPVDILLSQEQIEFDQIER